MSFLSLFWLEHAAVTLCLEIRSPVLTWYSGGLSRSSWTCVASGQKTSCFRSRRIVWGPQHRCPRVCAIVFAARGGVSGVVDDRGLRMTSFKQTSRFTG